MSRRLLVTSALPYANGPIHLGHLVEYLQTDIWVRFQKLRGRRVVYLCADDTHGTAIMLRARAEGRSELDLLAETQAAHLADFQGFQIEFDHYSSTNSPENRELCSEFWQALRGAGLITERDVTQLFDPVQGVFLADRFVTGTCPRCKTEGQYGDSCDKCGSTYTAAELLNPKSTLSGARPEVRSAPHYFVELEKLHPFLEEWTQSGEHLQSEVANYLKGHFLNEPLKDWDVSRPAPYFGFEIPDAPGHYWYVWFDAPIGYLATTKAWAKSVGESFDDWWRSEDVEVVHFIGKDIQYFHTLFWPAMLKVAGFTLPSRIQVHGFLTANGQKMSKRHGTFVMAATYLRHLDPAYLRYFYASRLGPKVDDLDLNFEEFISKVNSDLVGKVVNLASRTARFVSSLADRYPDDGGLFAKAAEAGDEIADAYEACDYAKAMRLIMGLADRANEFVDQREPWKLKKQSERAQELTEICSISLNLYFQIVLYLSPVLPKLAQDSARLLGVELESWTQSRKPLLGNQLAAFEHLMARVDPKSVEAIIEESKEKPEAPSFNDDGAALEAEPLSAECSFDDFQKVDLRVARVVQAEAVQEAKKLLKLTLSLGGGEQRTVFAGIKAAYEPEKLVGRLVVMVANLAPRKMKFGVSEGMVVAAGPGGNEVFVVSPDAGAVPGQRVH